MNNINVRVVGTANVSQMQGAFGKLESQVTALNAKLAQMVALQNGVDPSGYERMARAAAQNDKVFRSAVSSTGMFEQQQLRINRATDDYIDKLNRQKLSFREMSKQRKIATAAYREQLAMEQMVMRQGAQSSSRGRQMVDVMWSKQISSDLDTAANKLSFFNEQLKSGAHQMVNWGKNTQWAGRQLMVGFTMPIVAAGAAAGVLAYQMDKQFTRIQKVYDAQADANSKNMAEQMRYQKEMDQLREDGMATAIEAARQYGVAATDTLSIQAELAATGKAGAELQRTTSEVMRISRLGEIEYQDALSATIALQSTFRMSNEELTKSFNYMNAVENATSLATADFAAAIPIAAAPVKQFGGDVQELGVLLTAMKERGIEATQGANAIKAAMQRLGRPSKQVQEEWKSLTGTDITKLFEDSTSLIDLFQRISSATNDLAPKDKIKAFAGLFGTYQVTRMSALVEGMEDLKNGVGQVSDAYRIAEGSSKDWAATADREMKAYQKSISGRFDTALQELKAQVSTLGEPFVVVATTIMNAVSEIISGFNSLPKWVKLIIAGGTALGAIAGPLVMMTGLFANLFGNGVKILGAFLTGVVKLSGGMKIATAEQRAAAMAAEQNTTAMTSEARATELLRLELQKLTAAQAAANRVSRTSRLNDLMSGGMSKGAAAAQLAAERRRELVEGGRYSRTASGGVVNTSAASKHASDLEKNSGKTAKHWKNIGIGAATAAGAASIMLMHSEGIVGQAAKIVFYASLLGPLLSPMLAGMVTGFKEGFKWLKLQGGQMKKNLALSRATAATNAAGGAAGAAGGAGMLARAGSAVSGIGRGLKVVSKALGPAGWLIGGLGLTYTLWKNSNDEIKEAAAAQAEMQKNQANMVMLTRNWAEQQESVNNKFKTYTQLTGNAQQKTFYDDQIEFYRSKENKGALEEFGNLDTEERATDLRRRYIDLIQVAGFDPKEAELSMTAFLRATGMGLNEATGEARLLSRELGNLKNVQWGAEAKMNLDQLLAAFDEEGASKKFKAMADQFGPIFNQAVLSVSPDQAAQQFDRVSDAVLGRWSEMAQTLSENTSWRMEDGLREAAQKGGKALHEYYLENGKSAFADIRAVGEESGKALTGRAGELWNQENILENVENMGTLEDSLIGAIVESGELNGDIKTLADLLNDASVRAQKLTLKGAQKEAEELLGTVGMFDDIKLLSGVDVNTKSYKELAGIFRDIEEDATTSQGFMGAFDMGDDSKKEGLQELQATVEAFARANNIKIGKDWIQTYLNLMNGVTNATERGNSALDRMRAKAESVAGAYRSAFAGITAGDVKGMMQSSMGAVQQDIADSYRDAFDKSMNNALDSRQDMWDARTQAQTDRFEKQNRALDMKWERKNDNAEKYWDNRVKAINAAIEAEEKAEDKRKKMFDAEMARIDRLNEAMNRNIDFNVALNSGNFDEAAKIRNDVTASATQTALEAAANAGAGRSGNRVDRLEGRLEGVNEAREKQQKRLKRQEEAERRHLEKVQRMRERALSKQAEADMEAQREMWENRKDSLEDQLELFLSFTAANEKQLKKHMKNVGLSYDAFGKILERKGDTWGSFYGDALKRHLRKAGLELATDRMWKRMGEGAATEMLKGIGFSGLPEFRHFIKTGEMGGGGRGGRRSGGGNEVRTMNNRDPRDRGIETRHEGGVVGAGLGSRAGVARTTGGLHATERMVRAQTGEYIVNRRDAQENKDVLDTINSGKMKPNKNRTNVGHGVGGGSVPGMAGMLMAAINKGLAVGVGKRIKAETQKKRAANMFNASGGLFGAGTAGVYGDRVFSMAQLRNAATIASVGSKMGMSSRDLMIGIMTAITESGLVNVQYGDRDSLGLFQQRPSQGWGTPAQVTDPEYAARKFFEALKGTTGRGNMTPWAAAQAVQRSAFADGSNYRQYWDEATAIFSRGLNKSKNGGFAAGGVGYAQGSGGLHRASVPGKGWSNSHDYGNGLRSPLYAIDDGRIIESRALPPSAGSGQHADAFPRGYGSYGVTVVLRTKKGDNIRYAHMWPGTNIGTGPVKGGTMVGLSASTGNSSGPHTHFDVNGSYMAREWFANHGIPLRKGGTIKHDNTAAVLHKNERVLTAPLTSKLDAGIEAIYRATKGLDKKSRRPAFRYPAMTTGMADSPYTWFDVEGLRGGTARAGMSQPRGNGRAGNVRTGTYNLYRKSSNARSKEDLARLMRLSDILSLTEFTGNKRALAPWIKEKGWGLISRGGSEDSAIAYNRAKMEMLDSGYRKLSNKGRSGAFRDRSAAFGLFRDKDTGSKFWQVAAHTVGHAQRGNPGWEAVMNAQYAGIRELVKDLKRSGHPIFLAGDFNTNSKRTNIKHNFGLGNIEGVGLDRIFSNARGGRARYIRNGMSSDHPALLSSFNIPGLSTGGDIRWNNTLANLHKDERVLTAPLTKKLDEGLSNLAGGGGNVYNDIKVYAAEGQDVEAIADRVVRRIDKANKRKPGSRRA